MSQVELDYLDGRVIDISTKTPRRPVNRPRVKAGDPAQIVELRKSGKSFAAIARELNISDGIIQRRFKESGEPDPVVRRLPLDITEILTFSFRAPDLYESHLREVMRRGRDNGPGDIVVYLDQTGRSMIASRLPLQICHQ
jgi:hypothetical protein